MKSKGLESYRLVIVFAVAISLIFLFSFVYISFRTNIAGQASLPGAECQASDDCALGESCTEDADCGVDLCSDSICVSATLPVCTPITCSSPENCLSDVCRYSSNDLKSDIQAAIADSSLDELGKIYLIAQYIHLYSTLNK